jgi:hypothetical protein
MSINACSINEYTINTLCGRRRQAIIDSLRPPVPTVVGVGGQQQHVRHPLQAFRRDVEHEDHIDVNTLEHSHVQVTIELAGQTFTQTLQQDNSVPVVSIYALSVSDNVNEQVNISDISIKVL